MNNRLIFSGQIESRPSNNIYNIVAQVISLFIRQEIQQDQVTLDPFRFLLFSATFSKNLYNELLFEIEKHDVISDQQFKHNFIFECSISLIIIYKQF